MELVMKGLASCVHVVVEIVGVIHDEMASAKRGSRRKPTTIVSYIHTVRRCVRWIEMLLLLRMLLRLGMLLRLLHMM